MRVLNFNKWPNDDFRVIFILDPPLENISLLFRRLSGTKDNTRYSVSIFRRLSCLKSDFSPPPIGPKKPLEISPENRKSQREIDAGATRTYRFDPSVDYISITVRELKILYYKVSKHEPIEKSTSNSVSKKKSFQKPYIQLETRIGSTEKRGFKPDPGKWRISSRKIGFSLRKTVDWRSKLSSV